MLKLLFSLSDAAAKWMMFANYDLSGKITYEVFSLQLARETESGGLTTQYF